MAKWLLSTDHSSALFAARHMMVTWVRGFFTEVRGTLVFDPLNVAAATLTVEIAAASLYTGVAQRDNHLKSADFLDVANYPVITFASTGVEQVALDQAWVKGDLTIRGITRPVVLDARWSGPARFNDEGTVYTSFGFRGHHHDQPRGLWHGVEHPHGTWRRHGGQAHLYPGGLGS